MSAVHEERLWTVIQCNSVCGTIIQEQHCTVNQYRSVFSLAREVRSELKHTDLYVANCAEYDYDKSNVCQNVVVSSNFDVDMMLQQGIIVSNDNFLIIDLGINLQTSYNAFVIKLCSLELITTMYNVEGNKTHDMVCSDSELCHKLWSCAMRTKKWCMVTSGVDGLGTGVCCNVKIISKMTALNVHKNSSILIRNIFKQLYNNNEWQNMKIHRTGYSDYSFVKSILDGSKRLLLIANKMKYVVFSINASWYRGKWLKYFRKNVK